MVKLVENSIDPTQVYNSICSSFSGSVVFHYAVVKKQAATDKFTIAIEYKVPGNNLLELEEIAGELDCKVADCTYQGTDARCRFRHGTLRFCPLFPRFKRMACTKETLIKNTI